jgi:hypothetical protein
MDTEFVWIKVYPTSRLVGSCNNQNPTEEIICESYATL